MISARTSVAGVIGTPIRHSLSPAIFQGAFAACGLDWVYVAFDVADGAAPAAVAGARALGLEGLSVTMPHKAAVLPALDEVDAVAATLGAVNCIVRREDRLTGHNTDGAGFVDSLRLDEGIDVAGLRCVVLGAGGAGRAVAHALGRGGAASVVVVNRTRDKAVGAAGLAGPVGVVGEAEAVADADLVVNATSLGMGGDTGLPLDPARLGPGQLVVDLVYHPTVTPLLAAAGSAGARAVGGLGMLVHQAARAFELWTGEAPPLDAMADAARRGLAERGGT